MCERTQKKVRCSAKFEWNEYHMVFGMTERVESMSEKEELRAKYLVDSGAVILDNKNGDFRIDWSVAPEDKVFRDTVETMSEIRELVESCASEAA